MVKPSAASRTIPLFSKELYPYQREGIAFALAHPNTLLADEMGLGKTVQAVRILFESACERALVVCPASLKLNWEKEFRNWGGEGLTIHTIRKANPPPAQVWIVSYDFLKHVPGDLLFKYLVCDEAHSIKNPKAKRTQAIQDIASRSERRLFLTGTPILNRPVEIFALLQILAPETFDPPAFFNGRDRGAGEGASFHAFGRRYCAAFEQIIGWTKNRKPRTRWNDSGASNLDELNEKLRATCMIRRLKKDVLTELPDKIRQTITVDAGGILSAQERAYAAAGDEFYEAVFGNADALDTNPAFEDFSKVRHATALAKVDFVVEQAKLALEGGTEKVIVFAHHRDVMQELYKALHPYGAVIFAGGMSDALKNEAVSEFQTNKAVRVFVGSIEAAGVGITLTAGSLVLFAELVPVPAKMSQAEDRAHRIGQKDSVLVQTVVFEGSIDERLAKMLAAKTEVIREALDA